MLLGFPTNAVCGKPNTPGVAASIEAVPLELVSTFERVIGSAGEQRSNVVLNVGAAWLKIAFAEGSIDWNEKQEDGDQGAIYSMELTGFLPGDTPMIRYELTRWRNHRFLLRLRDKNGLTFISGDPERRGMLFTSKFSSGPNRGHEITFSGVALGLSPGYNPVF